MRMKLLILLFSISVSFMSCGQGNPKDVSTKNVLYSKGKLVSTLADKIWAIYQDDKGNYWFGSNGNGVFLYNGKELRQFTVKDGIADDRIREIKGDHLGNVFIGTPKGVNKYDGTKFTNLKPIISKEWKSESNDLWFNCNGNHIYRYDGENMYELQLPEKDLKRAFGVEVKGVPFKDMNNSPYAVYGINKDKAGNIWFGTVTAGAFRFDGKSFLWFGEKELSTLPDGRAPGVRSMIEDKDGNFWLSNFISKYRVNNKGTSYKKMEGISKNHFLFKDRIGYFNAGLADENGDLWMTTYSGDVWKYVDDKLINWKVMDGEMEALLISIYQDNNGVLWLGTDNLGVFRFNGNSFERFEPKTIWNSK